jgi:hypothetical protein
MQKTGLLAGGRITSPMATSRDEPLDSALKCENVIALRSQIGIVRAYCLLVGGVLFRGRFIFRSRAWKRGSARRLS